MYGGKKLAETLQDGYGDVTLNYSGNIFVSVNDIMVMWNVFSGLKNKEEIEI